MKAPKNDTHFALVILFFSWTMSLQHLFVTDTS